MSEPEMVNGDGYLTPAAIERVKAWDMGDPKGWLAFCRSIWWAADWGWPEPEGRVSTGGWSGNEDIIEAMESAQQGMLWHQVWRQSRPGGHYIFSLTKPEPRRAPDQGTPEVSEAMVDAAFDELPGQFSEYVTTRDDVRNAITAALTASSPGTETDTERLDWIEARFATVKWEPPFEDKTEAEWTVDAYDGEAESMGYSLREAIDAAMSPPEPSEQDRP